MKLLPSVFLIFTIIDTSSLSRPRQYIAFGDWGHPNSLSQISKLNKFLKRNEKKIDGVFLLGDNFYPGGISPSEGLNDPQFQLFSTHLAANISQFSFFSVLGNHDYMQNGQEYEILYNQKDPRWIMPDHDYFARFSLDGDDEDDDQNSVCVWFLDSVKFGEENVGKIMKSIQKEISTCVWTLVVSHYPMATMGAYRDDPTIEKFFNEMYCIVCRFGIDYVLSGHEHSSQVLHVPRLGGTVFLIAGASTETYTGSLPPEGQRPTRPYGPHNVGMIWGDDVHEGVVLRLSVTNQTFHFQFVQILEDGSDGEIMFEESMSKNDDNDSGEDGARTPLIQRDCECTNP